MRGIILKCNVRKVDIEKDGWKELLDAAKQAKPEKQRMKQVITILTKDKKIYSVVLDYSSETVQTDEDLLLERLKANPDVELEKMVCMWSDGCVDLPAYSLREKMIRMNPRNESVTVLLNGTEGFIEIPIGRTMKKKE